MSANLAHEKNVTPTTESKEWQIFSSSNFVIKHKTSGASLVDCSVVLQTVNHTINQRTRFVTFPEGASGEFVILD